MIQDLLFCLKQKISQMVNFGNKHVCNAKESTMREEPMYFKFKTHNKQASYRYRFFKIKNYFTVFHNPSQSNQSGKKVRNH